MSDPSLPLQAAIVAALKGNTAVKAIVGATPNTRVYDAVPIPPTFPYINLGQPQLLPAKATCLDGTEVSYTVHGWSRTESKSVEIKQLGAAIVGALDEVALTVTGHRVPVFEFEQIQYLDDPDGITKHVAVTFRALTEPSA